MQPDDTTVQPDPTQPETTSTDDPLFGPLGRLADLLLELDGDPSTVVTSIRVPRPLREALKIAVDLGYEPSVNEALVRAARDRLAWLAQRAALDEHYERHPELRPTLTDLAAATAALCGDPIAERPDLLAEAAAFVSGVHGDPHPESVVLVASALAAERAAA